MNDTISVVVPVYNTEDYLKRCIESVQNQTYKKYELILVNDGSTDCSGAICDYYAEKDEKIKVIHTNNSGVSAARNTGLFHITGKYFMFLDSDDSLELEALEKCYESLEKSDADAVIFGWRQLKNGQIVEQGIYEPNIWDDMEKVVYAILSDRHMYGGGYPNKMWKTATYKNSMTDIPQFDIDLFYVEDMEWVIRMLLQSQKITVIRDVFYNYYLRDSSVSYSQQLREKRLVGYHDTLEKIVNDLSCVPDIQAWFSGICYGELINSTLDAVLKKQVIVSKTLVERLATEKHNILRHSGVPYKYKFRCIALLIARAIKFI